MEIAHKSFKGRVGNRTQKKEEKGGDLWRERLSILSPWLECPPLSLQLPCREEDVGEAGCLINFVREEGEETKD